MKKIAIVGVIITNRTIVPEVQSVLSDFGDIIIGRMGVPDRANGINAIALIVEGDNEQLSALTGKLGRIDSVSVKSAVTAVEIK
ncbi:MAG TPA: CopG family transcriptional regulator [Candidatus Stercoripulliclostridium merdigallinarum]|uniref:CopG family transcriptional regulator n=1 Tax=Candidatus Stercoripulliclostridium merdigallinarum TaxID=2840951 RepID=A0A9D1MIH6_9FIRM|nr:CopG family transcriptional regulator [Candidatus Stercoripulliclostridium merdigallinarum]